MEEAMEKSTDEGVKALDYPTLRRSESLKKDMDFFYGEKWQDDIQPSPAAKAYVSRINEIAETEPYLMVAHQYTRYLGDLFGGQMMSGMARRSLSLENGDGTAFYTFDDIPSAKDFITEWYTSLNALDLTQQQKEDIVDEANLVFALNIDVLQELTGSPLKAMLTLAVNSLKEKSVILAILVTTFLPISMNEIGLGVEKDAGKEVYHLEKAAIGGHSQFMEQYCCVRRS
eukprot:scaffold7737_cov71-Skeletonema_dohrnii-CCMP3373.AAC.2